jgi:hypothetical protein
MLAEHPRFLRRLRQEILTKIGSTKRPTYDDMREMKFLRAFINGQSLYVMISVMHGLPFPVAEVLRLYPAV